MSGVEASGEGVLQYQGGIQVLLKAAAMSLSVWETRQKRVCRGVVPVGAG